MNFKKYLKNIEKKFVEQKPTRKIKPDTKITEEKIKKRRYTIDLRINNIDYKRIGFEQIYNFVMK